MHSVVIDQLRFHYSQQRPQHGRQPSAPVLSIHHFAVSTGERIFLHGPSGSGKSTLLSLLAGIHSPQQGRIEVCQQNITALSSRQRDKFRADHIGYIFQQFNLLPYLSCLDNVTLATDFSKARRRRLNALSTPPKEEAIRLLSHLGIANHLHHRKASALSVGQQQRVAAARALIGQPPLVIADEPTSALDEANRKSFIELLFGECKRANSSLIFVSHEQSLAEQFDRTVDLCALNEREPA